MYIKLKEDQIRLRALTRGRRLRSRASSRRP